MNTQKQKKMCEKRTEKIREKNQSVGEEVKWIFFSFCYSRILRISKNVYTHNVTVGGGRGRIRITFHFLHKEWGEEIEERGDQRNSFLHFKCCFYQKLSLSTGSVGQGREGGGLSKSKFKHQNTFRFKRGCDLVELDT